MTARPLQGHLIFENEKSRPFQQHRVSYSIVEEELQGVSKEMLALFQTLLEMAPLRSFLAASFLEILRTLPFWGEEGAARRQGGRVSK